jgi:hypothetical protein
MIKYFLILILLSLIFPLRILAQPGVALTPPIQATSIPEVLGRLANFIFTLALYILPVIIVIAGIFFVTAAGNPEQIEKGKKLIIYGLMGFIIILVAKGLINLIEEVFTK